MVKWYKSRYYKNVNFITSSKFGLYINASLLRDIRQDFNSVSADVGTNSDGNIVVRFYDNYFGTYKVNYYGKHDSAAKLHVLLS